jgi:hypothetical protein
MLVSANDHRFRPSPEQPDRIPQLAAASNQWILPRTVVGAVALLATAAAAQAAEMRSVKELPAWLASGKVALDN